VKSRTTTKEVTKETTLREDKMKSYKISLKTRKGNNR
jgi:hypothetical protein